MILDSATAKCNYVRYYIMSHDTNDLANDASQ